MLRQNAAKLLFTGLSERYDGLQSWFEKENINMLTESSEFLITLFSSFSQAESESISKNVGIGMKLAFKEGKVSFQYKKLLGYRRGADGGPEIVPEEAETVRLIYRLYLDGWSLRDIQRELTEKEVPTAEGFQGWSRQVIQNILINEKYIGDALLHESPQSMIQSTADFLILPIKKP